MKAARDCKCEISDLRFRISDRKSEIANLKSRLPFILHPLSFILLLLVGLLALSGASCPRMFTRETPPPRVLPPGATLEQVIQAVHQHSAQIQSYVAQSAWLSGPGWPTLHASIAFQRPLFFRLRAGMGLTGAEMDLGSNDQFFWYWVRRDQPPAVYFCRHEQFATSRARQALPIDPYWLMDALGVADFDPALPHQGPFPAPGGRLEIRTIRETPEGPATKITRVDAGTALVMEQYVYDATGRSLASALAEGYRRDPLSGLYMPSAVRISCPPAQFSMRIELGNVEINRGGAAPAELWSMPSYPGSPPVDLGGGYANPPAAATPGR